jgi:hypothetical protein
MAKTIKDARKDLISKMDDILLKIDRNSKEIALVDKLDLLVEKMDKNKEGKKY